MNETDSSSRGPSGENDIVEAKSAAFRQLAGGVAHDFNSLLTVITADANLLLETHGSDPAVRESAHRICAAGERAAALTQQLLMFSGLLPLRAKAVSFNDVLRDHVAAQRALAVGKVTIELQTEPTLPVIVADADMLEKISTNLIGNARDALPAGGKIVVTTAALTIAADDLAQFPGGRVGTFVRLTVADDGPGISAENLPRICEPFFTTKAVGRGIGLGLATVQGIVRQHGGWMTVSSTPGVTTRFDVYLPASAELAEPRAADSAPAQLSGGETLLFVEDEALLREITVIMLRKYGYRVLQAVSGVDALEVWKWYGPKIDLLVTDVVMPDKISGVQLAEKLRAEKPQLNVLFTSAYSREMMSQVVRDAATIHFLQKPYRAERLADAVRRALDGKPAL